MTSINHTGLSDDTRAFFCRTIDILNDAEIPFLLGGAYALSHYTGVTRHTKDLDVFVRPAHCQPALHALEAAGFETELTFEDWLGKAFCDEDFVDLIFSSRNRIAVVDDDWFAHSEEASFLGMAVRMAPAEETIWSKAFIMERERFDGADIAHILRARADQLDWGRMLRRFSDYWRILLVHLTLFGFIYPTERHRIPPDVMHELISRLADEVGEAAPPDEAFRGTILSGTQYRRDVEEWGYRDVLTARRNHTPTGQASEGDAHR